MIIILFLICFQQTQTMEKKPYELQQHKINGKNFMVPLFNLYDCKQYMLPKLDNAPVHHTFFNPKDLQQMYQEKGINPKQLNFNLDQEVKLGEKPKISSDIRELSMSMEEQQLTIDQKINQNIKKPRPPLRKSGFTHFIHVPFLQPLKQIYENQISPSIDEEDRDLLQPLATMHMTVMVFRLKQQSDLQLWSKVLKSAKRTRVNIRGVNIFPIKKNFSRVLYLNIKGLQDLIDRVVSKAIEYELITERQLSHIKFDKVSGTYKGQPHISLLRTKGEDIFDFTDYLKILKDVNVSKVPISEIRLSVIGSYDGEDYYNQQIVKL